ncbi:MAG TPA: MFS transporter [Candidatus Sulfotelmatobacter sp.]|nr:MFS transporter [Candidatus Sulfotelmatobacter sp.]
MAATGTRTTPEASLWSPARRGLTVGLVLTVTLVAFEALAVSTIMPVVARQLGDVALYGWAFSAFFLGTLVGIVAAGQQIDRGGLVRPFALGLALFGVGLTIGGLAPSMPVLIGARLVQGLGGGAIPTVTYVAIGRVYPDEARPRMFAILSTAWVVPGLAGPAAAAFVAQYLDWRYVFFGLLPILLVCALLTVPALRRVALPPADPHAASAEGRLVPAVVTAVAAGVVLAGLTTVTWWGFVLAIPALVVGVLAVLRLVPRGTLRARRGLPATIALRGIMTFGFFGAEAFLPLAIVLIRGQTPFFAGLALTSATITWTIGSWIQSHLVRQWGARALMGLGLACVAVGIAITATVLADATPIWVALVGWSLAGLGMGLCYPVVTLTVLREAEPGQEGSATASLQLLDVLGNAMGSGIGGALVATGLALAWDPHAALGIAFAGAVAALVLGLLVSRRTDAPTMATLAPSTDG